MQIRAWVGVDWGASHHHVWVIGPDDSSHDHRFDNSGEGIRELVNWISTVGGEPPTVGVAVELPHGALIDALLDAGFEAFAINPKQLDRFRDRYTVASAKDDRRDAQTLATSLKTDRAAYRPLRPESPQTLRLRERSHVLEDLKRELRRRTNQLRDLLLRYHVEVLKLVPAADEPWLWNLLEVAPTPDKGRRLRLVTVKRLLRERQIRRLTAEEVLQVLRATPLPASEATVEACEEHVLLLLPHLRLLRDQLRACERRMGELLDEMAASDRSEHRDVEVIRSLPGAGDYVTATVLVEASDALRRRDYHALRAQAGCAPVTRQSGKMRRVTMRRARNRRLQQAILAWSRSAILRDAAWRAVYERSRANGGSRYRALRGVADRLLKVVVVLLERGEAYDPQRRPTLKIAA
jgi:hypothetical protein